MQLSCQKGDNCVLDEDPQPLISNAAHAVRADHVNLIDNVLYAGNASHGFLHQLFQVEARQTTIKVEVAAFLLDFHAISTSAKVRVTFQLLLCQSAKILSLENRRRALGQSHLHIYSSCKILRQYCSFPWKTERAARTANSDGQSLVLRRQKKAVSNQPDSATVVPNPAVYSDVAAPSHASARMRPNWLGPPFIGNSAS
jgi:hypothetical protein